MTTDPLEYPTTMTFGQLVVEIGNGANPELFSAPAGFDNKAFNKTASASEANIPPTNAPDAPGFTARGISALSIEVTGSGVMATEDAPMWTAFWLGGVAKNVRVTRTGIDYWVGPAVLTAYNETAARAQNGNLVQASVTMSSAGPWTQTTGAPPASSEAPAA